MAAGRSCGIGTLSLAPWASRRRQDLLDLLDQLTPKIQELTRRLEEEVETRPIARLLMTHPGVGPLTALAFELVIGTPERFQCASKSPATWGWCQRKSPAETDADWDTSASRATFCCAFCWWKPRRSRCAAIRNGAASFFTWLCVVGGRSPKSRWPANWRSRLYWMWRRGWDYEKMQKLGSHAGEPGNRHGVQ